MRNAMQLKSIVKNLSKEKRISAQLVLQNYMLERLLERIALSKYKQNFIVKGGFLIAAMVGLDTRATMDMDVTIKGEPVNDENIKRMFETILSIPVDDGITFVVRTISEIREGDDYTGYRVSLTGNFPPMSVPLKLDVTTGDKITPQEIEFTYKSLFEDKSISVLAYNLETILAEKLEAIISRGDQTTRPRDYYDVYILRKLQFGNVNTEHLRKAIETTAKRRGTSDIMKSYKEVLAVCRSSDAMNAQWKKYQNSFDYAKDIDFSQTCDAVAEVMDELY
ncbi:MAG: nucleotidyl transferase AbiEii/AbiGii toxin family protein [Streptococcaceae bacterium]|jgi:predicted nucleotidyltransferase component of viral defense system|nr:nucleotidyl transferase AbiEii/AbiGii toxin family protein [Streptococcaceae bacterium]